MTVWRKLGPVLSVLGFVVLSVTFANDPSADLRYYRVETDNAYNDVVDDVKFAVSTFNFRVTGGNVIGKAISERHDVAFARSEVIHFCNLEFARRLLEINPNAIRHMPCKITVREDTAGGVVVEASLLPYSDTEFGTLANEINAQLRAIVDDAIDAH